MKYNIGDRIKYYRKPLGTTVYIGTITDVNDLVIEVKPDHKRGTHYIRIADVSDGSVSLESAE